MLIAILLILVLLMLAGTIRYGRGAMEETEEMAEMAENMQVHDRRRFERYPTSIPATVHWKDQVSSAHLSNISYGGAMLTGVSGAPHVGDTVAVKIHCNGNHIELGSMLTSRNIYTLEYERAGSWSFGVEFHDPPGEIEKKLNFIFADLVGV